EEEHARRRDSLLQWFALLNRAVFWFHPAAWWLERTLSGLAEEACDNAVLARGNNAREYAACLVELARSVSRSGARLNIVGMAVPGGLLRERLRKIIEIGPRFHPRVHWLKLQFQKKGMWTPRTSVLSRTPAMGSRKKR